MKFGTKEYFVNFMNNAIEKEPEKNRVEVIQRVHFSLTQFIFEQYNMKQAMVYVKNLTDAGEELSQWKKVHSLSLIHI